MLKNGKRCSILVADYNDDEKYYPTDRILIYKFEGKYYATGSFCSYCFANLGTHGVFLGDKITCPRCASAYDIKTGFVDEGPAMKSLSSFNIQIRNEKVQVVAPDHIPAFAKRQILERVNADPRVFVVVGDTEAAISAIEGLRSNFTGKILCITQNTFGNFENKDMLSKNYRPI